MIIFDMDGTLADNSHRQHFVKSPNVDGDEKYLRYFSPDIYIQERSEKAVFIHRETGERWRPRWQEFFEACDQDLPINQVCKIFWALQEYDDEIEIWSGRCESVRGKTEKWLMKNLCDNENQPVLPFILKMRPIGDNTPDDQLKERWLDEVITAGKTVEMAFDARKKDIQMWQRRGIFVFDVSKEKGIFRWEG